MLERDKNIDTILLDLQILTVLEEDNFYKRKSDRSIWTVLVFTQLADKWVKLINIHTRSEIYVIFSGKLREIWDQHCLLVLRDVKQKQPWTNCKQQALLKNPIKHLNLFSDISMGFGWWLLSDIFQDGEDRVFFPFIVTVYKPKKRRLSNIVEVVRLWFGFLPLESFGQEEYELWEINAVSLIDSRMPSTRR